MRRPGPSGLQLIPILAPLLGLGCAGAQTRPADPRPAAAPSTAPTAAPGIEPAVEPTFDPQLGRTDFNRLAVQLDVPLFWSADEQNPGRLDPSELVLLGVVQQRERFVTETGFTPAFDRLQRRLVERRRQAALAAELDQGRPTLVLTELDRSAALDHEVVRHIAAAARIIEELYALQNGSYVLRDCVRADDTLARAVFRRNQGPWCRAPATEGDPFCNACPGFPEQRSGLYPLDLQNGTDFCQNLAQQPQAEKLLDPFTVVRRDDQGALVAVPYHQAYRERMRRVARHLDDCAGLLGEDEAAFARYLRAAGAAFRDGDWQAADEAWAAMNAANSRWYLRIGPDEVYFEPCNRKAGFHVSFARIDPDSIYWQQKLTPLRQEMERDLAALIGADYDARSVRIHMPDFIAIILNAGDARSPLGATIGQSLPNWGPVAVEGRGRTVVMSNLYTDPDSRAIARAKAEALLSPEALRYHTEDERLGLLDIVLHEASHNFGPHSDYKIDGRRPSDVFGGALATVLEELKAQTGALYFVAFLRDRGLLSEEDARRVWLHAVEWCFGHISRGMVDASGRPKPYSQVAAVHIGYLSRAGALEWQADRPAANGRDRGRFEVHFERFAEAVTGLMRDIGRIKATGDRTAGATLVADFVAGEHAGLMHRAEVAERVLRHPKASFVYSVRY